MSKNRNTIRATLKRILLLALSVVLAYFAGVLLYSTGTDYQPEDRLPGETQQDAGLPELPDTAFSFLIWNLGYGGLGAENDFFYGHGMWWTKGHDVRPSLDQHTRYQKDIRQFLLSQRVDFYLLQEIDRGSRRSHFTDQVADISRGLPGFYAGFFPNYRSPWVPIPLLAPWKAYGKTWSGLATLSRYKPTETARLSLPGSFPWPTRLFMLDRCLGLTRYRLARGRELLVVNLHNEAYDSDGSLKSLQLAFLKKLVLQAYDEGNYVVVGGDWNQSPPFFREGMLRPAYPTVRVAMPLDAGYMPEGWRWAYDPAVPTNRSIDAPYEKGRTPVSLIDFYLVSPNVRVVQVKALDQGFRSSDHQPVWMEVRFEG